VHRFLTVLRLDISRVSISPSPARKCRKGEHEGMGARHGQSKEKPQQTIHAFAYIDVQAQSHGALSRQLASDVRLLSILRLLHSAMKLIQTILLANAWSRRCRWDGQGHCSKLTHTQTIMRECIALCGHDIRPVLLSINHIFSTAILLSQIRCLLTLKPASSL